MRQILVLSVLGLVFCFAKMDFIPAFASDPLSAKFFRGAYAAAYAPVAPIYRAATTAITLLLPLLFMFAIRKRHPKDIGLALACLAVILASLQRGPATQGLLLCFGVIFAFSRLPIKLFIVLQVAVYSIGSLLYAILAAIGLGSYQNSGGRTISLSEGIAAGAPDVSDQISFLQSWLLRPEFTHGKTFFGGLVPGHFQWNPAVWSLHITNPGQTIDSVVSGGLRLPAPLWGYVAFGWSGVVAVGLLSGLLVGIVARIASQLIPLRTPEATAAALIVFLSLQTVMIMFYTVSYSAVVGLLLVLWVFRPSRKHDPNMLRTDSNIGQKCARTYA